MTRSGPSAATWLCPGVCHLPSVLLIGSALLGSAAIGCSGTEGHGPKTALSDPPLQARAPADDPREQAPPRVEGRTKDPAPATTPRASGSVKWCSSGGAPIVGEPVVDDQERAYVATSDGYLHAFERDGRFRWSYTVKGTPLGSVSLRPSDGAILMGTTAKYVYAIAQTGTLRWSFQTLTPVWSGLFALNQDTVVFLGHDTRLYALGNNGAARYRVRAPGDPMGGPVIADDDVVWVPLADGIAKFEAAFRLEKFGPKQAIEQLVVLGDGVVARGGGQAYFVSAQGEVESLGAASQLAGNGREVLLLDDQDGGRIIARDLTEQKLVSLLPDPSLQVSAAPKLNDSDIWIPTTAGVLVIFDRKTNARRVVAVADRPLSTPVVGRSGTWALVPQPGGEFCAVDLSDTPSESK